MAEGFLPVDLCEDLVCCVICFEPFTESRVPKALPCLHTFCELCLHGSIMSHRKFSNKSRASKANSFPCPVCKEKTKIPDNGPKGFKDDFRIRRISDVLAKIGRSASTDSLDVHSDLDEKAEGGGETDSANNEDKEKQCDMCKLYDTEGKCLLATGYCLDCAKKMCRGCSEKHLNTSVTNDHKIVNLSDALLTEMSCKVHVGEALKYYCRTCSVAICIACTMSDEHPTHDMVKVKEESARMKAEIAELVKTCKEKVPTMKAKLEEFDKVEHKLLTKEKMAYKAILVRTLEEMSKIKANQAKMEQDLEAMCREKYQDVQSKKQDLKDSLSTMETDFEFAETIVESGQCLQIISAFDSVQSTLKGMLSSNNILCESSSGITNLEQFDELVQGIESDLGKDEVTARASILADIRSVASQMRSFSVSRQDTKCEINKKFGKKGTEDGEFNFPSGVAVLPNSDIVVADLHNHRIQIFDKAGTFKIKFGADGFKPCGVAVTRDGDIAVTDCQENANCIIIYSPEGGRKNAFGFGEFDYPFSLAIDSKGQFIVSDPAINKVTLLSADGGLIRRFNTKTKFAFYLAVNSKDEIIISDWYGHCIKIFDQMGQLVRKIGSQGSKDGQMILPLGVTTDKRGNILVLDCKNERISVYSPDGRFIKHLIKKDEGLRYSRAMAFSREGRVIVTLGDNRREVPNEVRVYQT